MLMLEMDIFTFVHFTHVSLDPVLHGLGAVDNF